MTYTVWNIIQWPDNHNTALRLLINELYVRTVAEQEGHGEEDAAVQCALLRSLASGDDQVRGGKTGG